MKSIYLLLIVLIGRLAFAGGVEGGNGGGGERQGNQVMTFGSVQVPVDPVPQPTIQVPMLQETIDFFFKSQYLTINTRMAVSKALGHQYVNVKQSDLDPALYNRIVSEYQKMSGLPQDEIVIFAVTEPKTSTTFLLPTFYQLKPHEQMAILFHEALWILLPGSQLANVVDFEKAFQYYLDQPTPENLLKFTAWTDGSFLSWDSSNTNWTVGERDSVIAAVQSDLDTGALSSFAPNGSISLKKLLGAEYFQCLAQSVQLRNSNSIDIFILEDCGSFWSRRMTILESQYPNSMILKYMENTGSTLSSVAGPQGEISSLSELENAVITFRSSTSGTFLQVENNTGWYELLVNSVN